LGNTIVVFLDSLYAILPTTTGIDFIESDEFTDLTTANNVQVTNAKGQFSSSLAEYVFFACSYFAKQLPRLESNKKARVWEKFDVQELRGKTMVRLASLAYCLSREYLSLWA
jgi:phosphoglycerate dehydrogenase-like enzyme